jgi:hypothetical protein
MIFFERDFSGSHPCEANDIKGSENLEKMLKVWR